MTELSDQCWFRHTIHMYRDSQSGDVMALNCLTSVDKEKRMEEAARERTANWDHTDLEEAFDRFLSEEADMAYLVDPQTYELVCGNLAFYRRMGKTEMCIRDRGQWRWPGEVRPGRPADFCINPFF